MLENGKSSSNKFVPRADICSTQRCCARSHWNAFAYLTFHKRVCGIYQSNWRCVTFVEQIHLPPEAGCSFIHQESTKWYSHFNAINVCARISHYRICECKLLQVVDSLRFFFLISAKARLWLCFVRSVPLQLSFSSACACYLRCKTWQSLIDHHLRTRKCVGNWTKIWWHMALIRLHFSFLSPLPASTKSDIRYKCVFLLCASSSCWC